MFTYECGPNGTYLFRVMVLRSHKIRHMRKTGFVEFSHKYASKFCWLWVGIETRGRKGKGGYPVIYVPSKKCFNRTVYLNIIQESVFKLLTILSWSIVIAKKEKHTPMFWNFIAYLWLKCTEHYICDRICEKGSYSLS